MKKMAADCQGEVPKKILITNSVACNTGDASILLGISKILRKSFGSDIRFQIFDSLPAAASKLYPEFEFRLSIDRRWKRFQRFHRFRFLLAANLFRLFGFYAVLPLLTSSEREDFKNYIDADMVVSTGGTYLVDYYPIEGRLFDLAFTLALGKPLVLFTQSIGPIHDEARRSQLAKLLKRAQLILIRDQVSADLLKALEIPSHKMKFCVDAAFALATEKKITERLAPKKLQVAISVRLWSFFQEREVALGMKTYAASILAATDYLLRKYNAEITFISTCQGVPEYWNDDSKLAELIVSSLRPELRKQVRVEKTHHSPEKLMEALADFDFVIATRMHMSILAMSAGVPVLPIAYEFKTTELFKRLGLETFTIDIEKITPEIFVGKLKTFIDELPKIRASENEYVRDFHREVFESGSHVRELWLAHAGRLK